MSRKIEVAEAAGRSFWRDRGSGRERLDPTPSRDLPDEVIQNLRSLGYVN